MYSRIFESGSDRSFAGKLDPEKDNGLFAFGRLYREQYLSEASPAEKVVLAGITNLCQSPWAQQHNGQINLQNWLISRRLDSSITPRNVGRHIHALKEKELINIELRDGKRWISVNADTSSSFIPFIIRAGPWFTFVNTWLPIVDPTNLLFNFIT